MYKTIIIITAAIVVLWVTTAWYVVYNRTHFQTDNFDLISFFKGNEIPLSPDRISYSVLISCGQRPVILAAFSMSPQAWQKFKSGFLAADNTADNGENVQQEEVPPYIKFEYSGQLIYLFDIYKNTVDGNVAAKCLIEM